MASLIDPSESLLTIVLNIMGISLKRLQLKGLCSAVISLAWSAIGGKPPSDAASDLSLEIFLIAAATISFEASASTARRI